MSQHAFILSHKNETPKERETLDFCKKFLCSSNENKNSCECYCENCTRIKNGNHFGILRIRPTSSAYTLPDIQPILDLAKFKLPDNSKFIFIIEKTELLQKACGNRLLKMVEEPSKNYIFLFLSRNIDSVLPTLKSRCQTLLSKSFGYDCNQENRNELVNFFLNEDNLSPIKFETLLKKLKPNHIETKDLISQLLIELKKVIAKENSISEKERFETITKVLFKSTRMLPTQGGQELFWKNFFIETIKALNEKENS